MRILSGLGLLLTMSLCGLEAGAQGAPQASPSPTALPPAPTFAPTVVPSPPNAAASPPPSAAELPPPGWQTSDIGWLNRYTAARERLVAGDFTTAEELFAALASTATNGVDQAVARELEVLAKNWKARNLVLVRRSDLGETTISAKAAGERTTDEISVLYGNAVLYGLGTGVWVGVLTQPDTAAGAILPALGLAGAVAGGVAAVDTTKRFRYGVPQSIVSGGYIGLEEGLVLTFWKQSVVARRDEWSSQTVATVIWGFTTAGIAVGGIVGNFAGTTPGRASFVGSAASWTGALAGFTAGALTSSVSDSQDDNAWLAAAIGLNAGAVAGILAAGPISPSIARVRFLDLGGIAGAVTFGGLYLSAAGDDSSAQGLLGLSALGMASGLTTAWFATAKMDPDRLTEATAQTGTRSVLATTTVSVVPAAGGATLAFRGAF